MKITPDVAEKLYRVYSGTVISPMPFEEFVVDGSISDIIWHTYEKGIVKAKTQLSRLYNAQFNNADLKEGYDIGFLNALSLCCWIIGGTDFGSHPKPRSSVDFQEEIDMADLERSSMKQKFADKLGEKDKEIDNFNTLVAEHKKKATALNSKIKGLNKRITELEGLVNAPVEKADS